MAFQARNDSITTQPEETLQSAEGARLPDFLIIGAMKSGTTSLHQVLNVHDDVFIPSGEIFFFDMDDYLQHPDFFIYTGEDWVSPGFQASSDVLETWYRGFFADATAHQRIGEDSTTYLASYRAPQRIKELIPDARLVVMLRDPASRSYSHYWHLVQTGRATYSFEDSLQFAPDHLIERSHYRRQLERYLRFFPQEQMKCLVFEEFLAEPQRIIDDVCEFIGVPCTIDVSATELHHNPAKVPKRPRLHLLRNRLLRRKGVRRYLKHFPEMPVPPMDNIGLPARLLERFFKRFSPLVKQRPPQMNPRTRQFLNEYFKKENSGLDELVEKNLSDYWYHD